MVTQSNLIYSASAAARILGIPVGLIKGFVRWWKVCWVWVKGKRPTFISLPVFKQHFVEWRKAQSRSLLLARVNSEQFRVVNPRKGTAYSVWALSDGLDCECEDFKNQIFMLKKACCKHCYRVLLELGFSSLQDYLIAQPQTVKNSIFPLVPRQRPTTFAGVSID